MISSISSIASGFSIFAITFAFAFLVAIICFNSMMSLAERTNESPIQSTSCANAKSKSSKSFGVKEGIEMRVFGKLTPFLDDNIPP